MLGWSTCGRSMGTRRWTGGAKRVRSVHQGQGGSVATDAVRASIRWRERSEWNRNEVAKERSDEASVPAVPGTRRLEGAQRPETEAYYTSLMPFHYSSTSMDTEALAEVEMPVLTRNFEVPSRSSTPRRRQVLVRF